MINRIQQPNILITNNANRNNQGRSFKSAATPLLSGLRFLDSSKAIGASAVDLCSMVIPRTTVEMTNRGFQSGVETGIREGSSWLLFAVVGVIGSIASLLTSGKFNNEYGIKAQKLFVSGDTINNMSALWKQAEGNTDEYFKKLLESSKGLNGTEWKSVSEKAKPEIIENLKKLTEKSEILASSNGANSKLRKEVADLKELITAQIIKDTGASSSYVLKAQGVGKSVSSNIIELVDNAVALANAFKTTSKEELPKFVKALSNNKLASTVLGLAVCAVLCCSVQPLNAHLTKKRTGEDGFVGVKGRSADKSTGFKALKTAIAAGFTAMALSSIGKLSDLAQNVQFNGKFATINQFKLLYGLTISSRFLSARDKDELREMVIKDTLGFTNWLIFGGMVSKLIARAIGGEELINNPVVQKGGKKGLAYGLKWLSQASMKSYDEILLPTVENIAKDGKVLKFTELFKKAAPEVKTKLFKIAGSQVAGYLYSGLVLGVGIAKLNIFITRKLNEKREKNNPQTQSENRNARGSFENVLNDQQKANKTSKLSPEDLSSVFKDFA